MNALTVITIIIILSAAVIGYVKGLVRCVFGVHFSVITLLLAYIAFCIRLFGRQDYYR